MAMALLSPQTLSVLPNTHRNQVIPRKWRFQEKMVSCSSSSSMAPKPSLSLSSSGFCRRRVLLLLGLSSSLPLLLPSLGCHAEEELKMATMVDEINAYTYMYPLELPSQKAVLKWAESRKPERYSSAAPLSPDARLRIVSERLDFADNIILSVSIGPPNFQLLKSTDKSAWTAKDVANSVLADKSAVRVTSTQRVAESSVLDTHCDQIDGEPYWYYEYLVRKSPTKAAQESNVYRRNIASTVERDGYFYTLNASTLSKQWDMMGPVLQKTVSSFRLLPSTDSYIPPYKDPWRFW